MLNLSLLILNNIVLIILIISIVLYGFYLRNHLLSMWQEVSRLEISFNAKLFETLKVYQGYTDTFKTHPAMHLLEAFQKDKALKFRHCSLEERKKLFKAMQKIYGEIYQDKELKYDTLKVHFEALQMQRLKYNSKVLVYNHKIHTFPVKIFAKKMQFLPKDYFG